MEPVSCIGRQILYSWASSCGILCFFTTLGLCVCPPILQMWKQAQITDLNNLSKDSQWLGRGQNPRVSVPKAFAFWLLSRCLTDNYSQPGWMKPQAGIRIAGRNINNLRYADDTTLMAESEELMSLLKVKEESEKVGLKLNIQKTRIMKSSSITSWQIDGETMETVTNCLFGLQSHCRWWQQPWNWKTLAPWKKGYDQPRQHIKKQRHYFANIGLSSQGYGFASSHVWMWELDYKESWTLKN